ncbi:MAG: hypothetical protein AB7D96_13040 [Arcobacteraceae bacterium]
MATQTIKRTYGKERTLGDIIYNPTTKSVFCSINLGFFGKKNITLIKRADDGAYDLAVVYTKNGEEHIATIGKTFPSKRKDGSVVEGLTQGTLGLLKRYDAEKKKEFTDSSDALFITTHKLKEPKALGDSGLMKVGYISGKFGIEDDIASSNGVVSDSESHEVEYDDDGEQIPF